MTGAQLQAAVQLVLWSAGVEVDCTAMPAAAGTTQAQVVTWAAGIIEPVRTGRFPQAARVLVWFIVRDLLADDWTMVDRWARYANTALTIWKG